MPRYTDAQIAAALTATRGMTYLAAQHLGCSHHTINTRLATSPRLRAIVEAQTGRVLDTAETKLFDAMQTGDLGAIKYLLSTKGKDRGYTERQEITGKDGHSLKVDVIVTVVDDRTD